MPTRVRTVLPAALLVALLAAAAPVGLPAQDAPPLTRIAFGSCADEEQAQPIWDAVLAYRPELFVFAGDNVYGDVDQGRSTDGRSLDELRRAYADAAALPGYAAIRAAAPVLATWDDHDYGLNDAGAEFALKREAQALFADFWDLPADDPRRRRDGVYHARTVGPEGKRVQVILLDTRYFRSPLEPSDQRGAPGRERYLPDPDPDKTMLGEAQWRWLRDRLREPAELRLIVSSIQVLADGHGWERWGNLPAERRRLYDLVAETGAGGIVFLSGDRHVGGLYRIAEGVPYPFVEITSSGLNMTYPAADEAGPNRLGALYGAANFGTVDIDWWAGEVRVAVRSMNGTPVRETTLRLADLRPD